MAQLNKNAPKDKIVEVHVWDVESKTKKSVLSKFHKRGIVLVSFSPSGERLLTIGQDDMNSLAVYDWKIQRK
jgi:WD40 repeat protein